VTEGGEAGFDRHHTATAYVVADGETLLHWHRGLRMWLPPGGHCEPNEDPVQAAVREAKEETGISVEVIPPPDLLRIDGVRGVQVRPPPAVILVEDIVLDDQPFHQHIDHVYFTKPIGGRTQAAPDGWLWAGTEQLADSCSLLAPDGNLVAVAEDVRLLGLRAIRAAVTE
jgi:8-oxo-dGTP pyrophosphatase MutT (NUDIX family)